MEEFWYLFWTLSEMREGIFSSTEDEYKIILLKEEESARLLLPKGMDFLNCIWEVKGLSGLAVIPFNFYSNKYNPAVQNIAVFMGVFLPVRLKYWFYLLNLRIIHLKFPFPGNTEKVWTFPSHSPLSVTSYYNQRSVVTSYSVESLGDDVSSVVGTFIILLE